MAESDKRLLYYNGQFLQEQDFTDEQQYHLDRQRRHNRLLHSHGIADGLAVTAEIGARHVTVHPGTAIDKQGRAIVLTELRNVAFEEAESGDLLVVIAYSEEPSDPATSGDPGNTRWLERPEVQVLPEAEALAEDVQIRLARLHLDEDGTLAEHDKTVRRSAGKLGVGTLEVQKPIGDAAQFIQDQNGTESSLAIGAGKVGVGTEDLTCAFTVAGDASFGPTVEVRSTGNDASIRYAKSDESGVWHAGVGPQNNFYFWNQESNASAVFTPEGTLIANNVATPDERDIKADRSTLDALALATIKGVSNAGGDIDIVGKNGISITGDNQAKSITVANAAGSLAVGNVLGAQPQPVSDAKGNSSALSIGSESVEIKTDKVRSLVATVAGNVPAAPLMELRNKDNEASIRYVNEKQGSVAWHAGVGGHGGLENFFFWNEPKGVVATIEPDGTLTTNGSFNVGSGTKDKGVLTVQGDTPAPLVEVRNKREEALIRFLNSDNEAWHIGTGGLGGAKNFALWNQTNGIVVTIMPDGSMVPRGTLYVGGGTKDKIAFTAESDNPGPSVEVRNKQEEATIRYVDKNNVPWHVGTGGLGGAENFFIWNGPNHVVATITPEGTLTAKGLNASTTAAGLALAASGNMSDGPMAELKSAGNEASLRFKKNQGVHWIAGTGGQAEPPESFFFWNSAKEFVATIEPDGSTTTKGTLNVGGGTKDKVVLTVEGDRNAAPTVEVLNKENEASIRYLNLKDNVAWHSGTGGGGGAKNFFFWSQTHGIVWTIEPDGAPTMKGIPARATAPDVNRLKPLLVDPITGKIYRGD